MIEFYGDINEAEQEILEEVVKKFEGNWDLRVMTDDARDKEVSEYIRETMWAFNPDFILSHVDDVCETDETMIRSIRKMQESLCESANPIILAMVNDFEEFVENAVNTDGYGSFLAGYDHNEEEVIVNGTPYFIYRD